MERGLVQLKDLIGGVEVKLISNLALNHTLLEPRDARAEQLIHGNVAEARAENAVLKDLLQQLQLGSGACNSTKLNMRKMSNPKIFKSVITAN
ncbi:hypothetical protein Scep_009423 [Stephania cephalantha]|uniref:Uncharacterized protein n=1 Tax=Stephania cephalantha TaxID=152367 RepID=A0AAP0JVM3_9MAGN